MSVAVFLPSVSGRCKGSSVLVLPSGRNSLVDVFIPSTASLLRSRGGAGVGMVGWVIFVVCGLQ